MAMKKYYNNVYCGSSYPYTNPVTRKLTDKPEQGYAEFVAELESDLVDEHTRLHDAAYALEKRILIEIEKYKLHSRLRALDDND